MTEVAACQLVARTATRTCQAIYFPVAAKDAEGGECTRGLQTVSAPQSWSFT